jgi:hypothetical protein
MVIIQNGVDQCLRKLEKKLDFHLGSKMVQVTRIKIIEENHVFQLLFCRFPNPLINTGMEEAKFFQLNMYISLKLPFQKSIHILLIYRCIRNGIY